MQIGIDARFYGVNAGIGRYLRNLISELQKMDKSNEYYLFLLKKDIPQVKFSKNFHPVEANFSWYGFEEQIKFPKVLRKYNLDLVHFPHFNVPVLYKGKFVVTIHDLIHSEFKMKRASTRSKVYYEIKQLAHKRVLNYAIKRSQRIITVSEYVKGQLAKKWGVGEKMQVIHEGVEEGFIKLAKQCSKENIAGVLKKYQIEPPFIYYIGAAHPHKNVEGLIKAFMTLRKKYQYLALVLAGEDNFFWQRIKREYKHKDIRFVGFVSDADSIAFLKSASCYVQPSLEEGFGLPILEAFICRCPVVSSDRASLPEIAGDGAIYFDPKDKDDIADKIVRVLNDQKLKKELIEEGNVRLDKFSFKKMAEETLKIYNSVV